MKLPEFACGSMGFHQVPCLSSSHELCSACLGYSSRIMASLQHVKLKMICLEIDSDQCQVPKRGIWTLVFELLCSVGLRKTRDLTESVSFIASITKYKNYRIIYGSMHSTAKLLCLDKGWYGSFPPSLQNFSVIDILFWILFGFFKITQLMRESFIFSFH